MVPAAPCPVMTRLVADFTEDGRPSVRHPTLILQLGTGPRARPGRPIDPDPPGLGALVRSGQEVGSPKPAAKSPVHLDTARHSCVYAFDHKKNREFGRSVAVSGDTQD